MKRAFTIILSILVCLSVHAQTQTADSLSLNAGRIADELIEKAHEYLGRPYKYGASGPSSFDCAGFAQFIYKKFGFNLSRSSKTQIHDGRPVDGGLSDLQKGDLLIFSGSRGGKTPGHVGIFIGLNEDGSDGTFIHAARGGVQVTKLSAPYYKSRFICVRRVLPDFVEAYESGRDYAFDMGGDVIVRPDTLELGINDLRAVIFSDGKWALVDADGKPAPPSSEAAIVLYPNGDWKYMSVSGQSLPSIAKASETSNTDKAPEKAQVQSEANVTPEGGDEMYHMIKSGDTLSKIATKYHTSVKALCGLNGITERTVLHIGRKLRVK